MKLSHEVIQTLSQATIEKNSLTLPGTLDRKLYQDVDKALKSVGGKWNKKLKAHIFEEDCASLIQEILNSGSVVLPDKDFDFFPTPPELVDYVLINFAYIGSGIRVLEPSAGKGAFALPLREKGCEVDCVELYKPNADYLRNLGFNVVQQDFLTVEPNPIYDLIVMNPPFGKQADIKHANHAIKFLKPGGQLVCIMTSGATFREDKLAKGFREYMKSHDGVMEPLPQGSFKDSGTMVNTVCVTLIK